KRDWSSDVCSSDLNSARPPFPYISICRPVEPNVVNQIKASTAGAMSTPAINSRMVLPLEILAINKPINGAQEICHAQKKIVLAPSHSLSLYVVSVKLILRKLVI